MWAIKNCRHLVDFEACKLYRQSVPLKQVENSPGPANRAPSIRFKDWRKDRFLLSRLIVFQIRIADFNEYYPE